MIAPAEPASEATARAKADGLRRIKYRLVLVFLLLPGLLVAAIIFDFLWEQNLGARLTRSWVIAIYGGLIAFFGIVSCLIGYFVRKRMRRDEEAALAALKTDPKSTAATPRDGRSRH